MTESSEEDCRNLIVEPMQVYDLDVRDEEGCDWVRLNQVEPESLQSQDGLQEKFGPCMPTCPARRLAEEDGQKYQQCLEDCPSIGFLAAMQFGECKLDCQRKFHAEGITGQLMSADPPLEGCRAKCREKHRGNFWHLMYTDCAKTCTIETAVAEAQFQRKNNMPYPEDMEFRAEVQSVLKFRIHFDKRSELHPFSFLLMQYQGKILKVLSKALNAPVNILRPKVTLKPYQEGVEKVVPTAVMKDPGNDVEVLLDVKGLHMSQIEKLAGESALKQIDKELQEAVSSDPLTKGYGTIFPAEALESTSSSVQGNFVSMGWHTVCRMNEADHTYNAAGQVSVVHGQTLLQCSMLCNDWHQFCYGFEFRSSVGRCEIWTIPICAHSQANVANASFTDFRCFKRCNP